MMYFGAGSPDKILNPEQIKQGLYKALDLLGKRSKVIAVPPDITLFHSYAGPLTELVYRYYGNALTDVLQGQDSPDETGDDQLHQKQSRARINIRQN